MKPSTVASAVVALVVMAASGSVYGQDTRGQSGGAGATAQRPADRPQSGRADSKSFINEMAIAGMAEVQLGKLADERAENADVKGFGQMMVKDHSQANDELKQVASELNVQLPTQLDQKHRQLAERLSKLQGAEFDREYMNAMVQGHEEVVSKLRMRTGNRATADKPATTDRPASGAGAGASGTEASGRKRATGSQPAGATGEREGEQALSQWATKTLPIVQKHLERARELQQKVAK